MREMAIVFGKRVGEKEKIIKVSVLTVANKGIEQLNVEICPINNKEMKKILKMTQLVGNADKKDIVNRNVRTLVNQITQHCHD